MNDRPFFGAAVRRHQRQLCRRLLIGCITRRGGTSKANYLLDIRTGEVTPI